jgi:hypothetical protein
MKTIAYALILSFCSINFSLAYTSKDIQAAKSSDFKADSKTYIKLNQLFLQIYGHDGYEKQRNKYQKYVNHVERPQVFVEDYWMLSDYASDFYSNMNKYLRGQTIDDEEEVDLIVKILVNQSALHKLPKFKGKTYRASSLGNNVLKTYKDAWLNGLAKEEKAFTSTSIKKSILTEFDDYEDQSKKTNTHFYIVSRSGVKISDYSPFGDSESEVLLPFGLKFCVDNYEVIRDGITKISLREFQTGDAPCLRH